MKRRVFCFLLIALALAGFSACQPNITVSTDPRDSDFSAFHPEVVAGDGFTIQPDVRVFTLYAFLNGVVGWEEEFGDGFSPERQALRDALEERLAQVAPEMVARWRKFYTDHPKIPFSYLYYTLTLGAPPEFDYIVPVGETQRSGTIYDLDGFNKVLAEFYAEAGLQALYEEQFRALMMEDVTAYDLQAIAEQVDEVYRYTRLERAAVETFDLVIIPNPFDTHFSAMSIGYQKRLYIVDGPGSNDRGLNVHEYLHMLMDHVLPQDLGGEEKKFRALLDQNIDSKYVRGSYEEVGIFVEEALVRALDYRMRIARDPDFAARVNRVIADDVTNGLVLVDDFYQALEGYEQERGVPLKDFVTRTLKTIPADQ